MYRNVTVSEELFTEFRKNWVEWYNAGMPDCDENLKDLIVKFNKLEGVVTRFCCDGHPDEDEGNSFYICTVCTEEGIKNIFDIYGMVRDQLPRTNDLRYDLTLEISELMLLGEMTGYLQIKSAPCVTFRARPNIEQQRKLIDLLSTSVDLILSNKG